MPKNIVICCDGTGNEFGRQNSNVVKLYSVLDNGSGQVAYYHPGVGTIGAQAALTRLTGRVTRVLGLAFGYGVSANIADAYQFLMRVYDEGDRVFVFGFSRGAYTARALCSLLHMIGLLTAGNAGMIPYAFRMFRSSDPPVDLAREFTRVFSRPCRTHFLGVWDTVSSVGWVYDAVHFPFIDVNPDLHIVRHALALDERRVFYRHSSFTAAHPEQDIREVWFAGAHSDVGGSYHERESGLSKIALRWMLGEAEQAGLRVDAARRSEMFAGAGAGAFCAPSAGGELHQSLFGWWRLAEWWPELRRERPGDARRVAFNRGRCRDIPAGALVHESVLERMRLASAPEVVGPEDRPRRRAGVYRPANLTDMNRYQVVADARARAGEHDEWFDSEPAGSIDESARLAETQSHVDHVRDLRDRDAAPLRR